MIASNIPMFIIIIIIISVIIIRVAAGHLSQ